MLLDRRPNLGGSLRMDDINSFVTGLGASSGNTKTLRRMTLCAPSLGSGRYQLLLTDMHMEASQLEP